MIKDLYFRDVKFSLPQLTYDPLHNSSLPPPEKKNELIYPTFPPDGEEGSQV